MSATNRNNPFTIQEGSVRDRRLQGFNSARHDGDTLLFLPTFSSWLGKSLKNTKLFLFTLVVLVLYVVLIARVMYLQAWEGGAYRILADRNRTKTIRLHAPRGIISDRFGNPLVKNESRISLYVNPQLIDPGDEASRLRDLLISELPHRAERISEFFNDLPDKTTEELLDDDIAYEEAIPLLVKLSEVPSMHLAFEPRRTYLHGLALAPLIGYIGKINEEELRSYPNYARTDMVGKQGVEKSYESILKGQDGFERIEVDALGREKDTLEEYLPVKGTDITLTIDVDAQRKLYEVLQGVYLAHRKPVAGIVLEPQTGEVIAAVSLPTYDANIFSSSLTSLEYDAVASDPGMPMFLRSIAGAYPAGSIFKMAVAAGALEEGIITDSYSVNSTGGIYLGDRFFADWNPGGHGVTNVYKAIADSVNTFFYIIGGGSDSFPGLGVDLITDYARKFGFGSGTGIDLPGESEGFVPSREWKSRQGERWFQGDTYNLSIGQGSLLVTPVQVTRYTAYFANGGKLIQPHVLKQLEGEKRRVPSYAAREIPGIDPHTISILRTGMRQTVLSGTAQSLQQVQTPVAGKTGTAQFDNRKEPHSWFTGFAPYDSPQVVITVLVEEGGDLGYSVQAAREFLTWFFAS